MHGYPAIDMDSSIDYHIVHGYSRLDIHPWVWTIISATVRLHDNVTGASVLPVSCPASKLPRTIAGMDPSWYVSRLDFIH